MKFIIGITKALIMKGCSCAHTDPVIRCCGSNGWLDIKALNDTIYYVMYVSWVLYCIFFRVFVSVSGDRGVVLLSQSITCLADHKNLGIYQ